MALAGLIDTNRVVVRSVSAARAAGAEAVAKLAEAERLRAEAVAGLVEFDAIDAHAAEGFATPQRHMIVLGNVIGREAERLHRIVRFCGQHTLVADALEAGEITVDHADVLRTASHAVGAGQFNDDLLDLLRAACGVDFSVFKDRIEVWQWRVRPEQTEEEVEARFTDRYLTLQGDIFGESDGRFHLDAAGTALVTEALFTKPDPANSVAPQRTLKQRQADRLVELADLALNGTPAAGDEDCCDSEHDSSGPSGARQTGGRSVDVVIDLPTLLGIPFDLDNHRTADGQVDWSSIQQSLTATGSAPRPVLAQFFCDASYRQLITSGERIVLDYNKATPDIPRALRRAIQRRDGRCQFDGCDRKWQWCDVHHLVPSEEGGLTNEQNLALVCRFHHTLIHQGGWKLIRQRDGRLLTTSPCRSLRSLTELLADAHNSRSP